MDQCTHAIRKANWSAIIADCQNRPAGMTVKQWLSENNVREKAYYYHQRKLRQAAYDQIKESSLPALEAQKEELTFTEIPYSPESELKTSVMDSFHPDVVIQNADMVIGFSNTASKELLSSVLKEVLHAR